MAAGHEGASFAARAIWTAASFGRVKQAQVRTADGIPPEDATRILEQLAADGWLEPEDCTRGIWRAGPVLRRMDVGASHTDEQSGSELPQTI
ncbi:MAG: hypothetical protein ABEJ58_03680 [Halodesulfurarchaeum sp.]